MAATRPSAALVCSSGTPYSACAQHGAPSEEKTVFPFVTMHPLSQVGGLRVGKRAHVAPSVCTCTTTTLAVTTLSTERLGAPAAAHLVALRHDRAGGGHVVGHGLPGLALGDAQLERHVLQAALQKQQPTVECLTLYSYTPSSGQGPDNPSL